MATKQEVMDFFKNEKAEIDITITYREGDLEYWNDELESNKKDIERLIKKFNALIAVRKQLETQKHDIEEELIDLRLRKEILWQIELGYFEFSL